MILSIYKRNNIIVEFLKTKKSIMRKSESHIIFLPSYNHISVQTILVASAKKSDLNQISTGKYEFI